jgi:hypothetical protein
MGELDPAAAVRRAVLGLAFEDGCPGVEVDRLDTAFVQEPFNAGRH